MSQTQIDAARMLLRALRRLEAGRRQVEQQWRAWTEPDPDAPEADRRKPPEVW